LNREMPRLALATTDQVEKIYKESHALWGAGLELEDYIGLWREISTLPWSRRHARFLVWLSDEGLILSSLKLYRPLLRAGRRTARAAVLGAIFTPTAIRGRGHASDMVKAVIEQCRGSGEALVLLFSDIGTAYYQTFGFIPLSAEEQWGALPRIAREVLAGWRLRPLKREDMAAIYRAHDDFIHRMPLAIIRDEDHWHFLQERSRGYFERLQDRKIRQSFRVALHDNRFAGYLMTVEGHGEWNVREVGAVGGDPGKMAIILRLGAAEARRSGLRRFYGWFPRELVELLEDWQIKNRARHRAVPMVLPLDESLDTTLLHGAQAPFIPYHDQF
jgi:predicted N-acetyltransferase YhbS